MYICKHCNLTFKDVDDEGLLKFRGKLYCRKCEEPVDEVSDTPQIVGSLLGAQATLISNSDNRIITNNYYGGGTPDEKVETPYGPCRKNEARLCKQCRQWIPLAYFNQEKCICYDCELKVSREFLEEGKSFFEMQLYDNAINCFLKYESVCTNEDQSEIKTLLGRCYYELNDYKRALNYFVVASRKNSESLYYLGLCYYYGYGVESDGGKGLELIQNAANQGLQQAIDFLAGSQLVEEQQNEPVELFIIERNGKYGFMNRFGKIIAPCQWEEVRPFEYGLAKVKNQDERWGFIDRTGKNVIPCQWGIAEDYKEGIAAVYNSPSNSPHGYGFIDKTGKTVIPFQWRHAYGFHEGLACVMDEDGKYGFINRTGKIVIPCQWEEADDFSEGLARVKDQDDKWGYIDKTGKVVIPYQWEYALDFYNGFAVVVNMDDKRGLINKAGELAIPCQWEGIWYFEEGLASVRDQNGKWGYIDITGKIVIPFQWDEAYSFIEGLARVRQGWKYGYIDKTGVIVIPCQWYGARDFKEGLAAVYGPLYEQETIQAKKLEHGNRWSLVNKIAKKVLSGQWQSALSEILEGQVAEAEQVQVPKQGWGFIDKTGKFVIPSRWGRVSDFNKGLAWVGNDEYVNKYGTVITPEE